MFLLIALVNVLVRLIQQCSSFPIRSICFSVHPKIALQSLFTRFALTVMCPYFFIIISDFYDLIDFIFIRSRTCTFIILSVHIRMCSHEGHRTPGQPLTIQDFSHMPFTIQVAGNPSNVIKLTHTPPISFIINFYSVE